jgi:hypothetical protein
LQNVLNIEFINFQEVRKQNLKALNFLTLSIKSMKSFSLFLTNLILFCTLTFNCFSNYKFDSTRVLWRDLKLGLKYSEIASPIKTSIGDNKIYLIQFDPKYFEFELISATKYNKIESANYWIDSLKLNLVFNAGMHQLKNERIHRYLLKDSKIINNPYLSHNVNGIIAFNPKFENLPMFTIFDLKCDNWKQIDSSYNSVIQGMRMIDCNGIPTFWESKDQICSMLIVAMDTNGKGYLIFTRSPFTHNQMINIMKSIPLNLINAVYLEGGTRANFVLTNSETTISKVGSYVSIYNENDMNNILYPLPNFIGLRSK